MVIPFKVVLADLNWVVEAPPPLNWCNPLQTGVIDTDKAGEPSERIKVLAVPLFAVNPSEAVGFAPVEVESSTPFVEIVPETFTLPDDWVIVDVPLNPPEVVTQKGKLLTVIPH